MTPDDAFGVLVILLAACVGLLALWVIAEIVVVGCVLRLLFKQQALKGGER